MVVGILSFEIYIPASTSLKEKRYVIKSMKDKLKNRFNISIAEIDFHDKWQRSLIGIVTIGNEYGYVEKSLKKVFDYIDNLYDFEIIKYEFEYV